MNTMVSEFLCHLMCAAQATYGVQPDGSFVEEQPYYGQVGFIGTPRVISDGLVRIDAALVGLTAEASPPAFEPLG